MVIVLGLAGEGMQAAIFGDRATRQRSMLELIGFRVLVEQIVEIILEQGTES
jgi:hypothetical protein